MLAEETCGSHRDDRLLGSDDRVGNQFERAPDRRRIGIRFKDVGEADILGYLVGKTAAKTNEGEGVHLQGQQVLDYFAHPTCTVPGGVVVTIGKDHEGDPGASALVT